MNIINFAVLYLNYKIKTKLKFECIHFHSLINIKYVIINLKYIIEGKIYKNY